eukprot:scaffold10887_cov109-Isochrysis_galbana.AAC.2
MVGKLGRTVATADRGGPSQQQPLAPPFSFVPKPLDSSDDEVGTAAVLRQEQLIKECRGPAPQLLRLSGLQLEKNVWRRRSGRNSHRRGVHPRGEGGGGGKIRRSAKGGRP